MKPVSERRTLLRSWAAATCRLGRVEHPLAVARLRHCSRPGESVRRLSIAFRRFPRRRERPPQGGWWNYFGSFGDDFFGQALDDSDGRADPHRLGAAGRSS